MGLVNSWNGERRQPPVMGLLALFRAGAQNVG